MPDFIDTPVHDADESAEELLATPFLLVRVAAKDENGTPLFKVYYGSGMGKEDVPYVAEMLAELFPVQRWEGRSPDEQGTDEDSGATG